MLGLRTQSFNFPHCEVASMTADDEFKGMPFRIAVNRDCDASGFFVSEVRNRYLRSFISPATFPHDNAGIVGF